MLTKSDYLLFLDAPMHLWAKKHDRIETVLSAQDRHLFEQGQKVGKAAQEFLREHVSREYPNAEISFEQTYVDRHFQARVDGLLHDVDARVYDLFEVKSSSRVKPENIYDLAFQRFVCEAVIPIRHTYLVHLNGEYIRQGEINLDELFLVENLDEQAEDLRQEVLLSREEAFEIAARETPNEILECVKPKTCPCPSLCHPELPEHSIYNLPRLSEKKKRALKAEGILAIKEIPDDYKLSAKQALHAKAIKSGQPIIDYPAIKASLAQLEYPLYFLDYETFNPAIPQYDGFRPHEHMVFQYSLHVFQSQSAVPQHYEFIATQPGDPSRALVEHLAERIGESGSVIVWNQSFEATRNKDMAARYPEYAEMLLGINTRMYDLMKIFSRGHYVHPDFHGSASIKAVLPVLVGDISYQDLTIGKGDEAMAAWVEIMRGMRTEEQVEQTKQDLLKYCEQDTMAMVRNWEFLEQLVGEVG